MTLDKSLAQLRVCDLETIGRVTGRPRLVEMWFAADPTRHRLYMLAGSRDQADWTRNVRHDGSVPDEQLARRLLAAKYYGWSEGRALNQWARNSLPVAIDLTD
jgi:hypothetical protein